MELYGKKTITRRTQIKDECGKPMLAMKVFSAGIKYLKDHMMDICNKQLSGIMENEIRWVLTVPAIWSDSSKQFMRESAEQAGKSKGQLVIALEAEAASLYCKHLPLCRDDKGGLSVIKSGTKYVVLDAGGGTIDITVHEVQHDGSLREIHKANGGDWGGTKIDDAFRDFMSGLVGDGVFRKFCQEDKADLLELFRCFEVKKRTIKPDDGATFSLKIPMNLNIKCKSSNRTGISERVASKEIYRGKVSAITDKLRIKSDYAQDMFREAISKIVDHLEKLLRHPDVKSAKQILMVGGFSESLILQDVIKRHFQNMRVIIPQDAGLAVVKGAEIFGHEPRTINCRICKVSYGVETHRNFYPGIHPESKRLVRDDGAVKCRDIFSIHIREGDVVNVGEPQPSRAYSVMSAHQTGAIVDIWMSHQRDPKYTTDKGCQKLGSIMIHMPSTSRGLNRRVNVQMKFGGTELEVEAADKDTGESVSASFDFL